MILAINYFEVGRFEENQNGRFAELGEGGIKTIAYSDATIDALSKSFCFFIGKE